MDKRITIKISSASLTNALLTWMLYGAVIYQLLAYISGMIGYKDYISFADTTYYGIYASIAVLTFLSLQKNKRMWNNLFVFLVMLFIGVYFAYTKVYFPDNFYIIQYNASFVKVFMVFLPTMWIAASHYDLRDWLSSIRLTNVFMNILALFFLIRRMQTTGTDEAMDIAYMITLCTIINIYFWKKKIKRITLSLLIIVDLLMLFGSGCRGAVLVAACYIIASILQKVLQIEDNGRKVLLSILLIAVTIGIYYSYVPIVLLLSSLLKGRLFSDRIINYLVYAETSTDGGRTIIQNKILNGFSEMPTFGYGFLGDGKLTNGLYYAHNIELEWICNFGWIVGVALIVVFAICIFKGVANPYKRDVVIVFVCYTFIHLQISSTYLMDASFWIFLGILLNKTTEVDYYGEYEVMSKTE